MTIAIGLHLRALTDAHYLAGTIRAGAVGTVVRVQVQPCDGCEGCERCTMLAVDWGMKPRAGYVWGVGERGDS